MSVPVKGEVQMSQEGIKRRGFASMDPEKRKKIASKGGKSVPADRRSFSQDPDLASRAGRKGGQASHYPRRDEE